MEKDTHHHKNGDIPEIASYAMNETPDNVETHNQNDTPREDYDLPLR